MIWIEDMKIWRYELQIEIYTQLHVSRTYSAISELWYGHGPCNGPARTNENTRLYFCRYLDARAPYFRTVTWVWAMSYHNYKGMDVTNKFDIKFDTKFDSIRPIFYLFKCTFSNHTGSPIFLSLYQLFFWKQNNIYEKYLQHKFGDIASDEISVSQLGWLRIWI